MQTNKEAVLSHLARKAGGGRRIKDLRAFFTSFREEDSQHESMRLLMTGDERPEAWQGESSNERKGF